MMRVCPNCKTENPLPTEGDPSNMPRPVCSKCREDLFPQIANSNRPKISGNTYSCKFVGLQYNKFVLNTEKGTIRIQYFGHLAHAAKVDKNKTSQLIWDDKWGTNRLKIKDDLSAILMRQRLTTYADDHLLYVGKCLQS